MAIKTLVIYIGLCGGMERVTWHFANHIKIWYPLIQTP